MERRPGRISLRVLLDTHAALWWADRDRRLSDSAAQRIARADTVLISPVTCWEIATLVRLGRITLDRALQRWIDDLFEMERVHTAPLTGTVGVSAGLLTSPFPNDPADRLLYATAADLMVPFVTKDRLLASHAIEHRDVEVIW